MAIKWRKPHSGSKGNPDVTIRVVRRGKGGRKAVFTFSRTIVDECEFTHLDVGFDGQNRIYFRKSERGYSLVSSVPNNPNSRLRFLIQDKQLCSLCAVKNGPYKLKYDPHESAYYIDLTEHKI